MAKIRIGLGSDFALNNGRLGLGVSDPQVRLEVDGTAKSNDLVVTGVTSFTAYEGFLRADHQIDQDTILNVGQGLNASISGEIIVKDGTTVTVGAVGLGTTSVGVGTELITNTIDSNAVNLAGGSEIECLKVFNTFTPPSGGTNERPYAPKPGQLYYNYDFKTIEFFDGNNWRQVDNTTRSGRGVLGGGYNEPVVYQAIDYINISTTGNAQNFGDLTVSSRICQGCASAVRGLHGGGTSGSGNSDHIDYVTMASTGNAIDFGDTFGPRYATASFASGTRALFAGGYNPSLTPKHRLIIDYVEIATTGDAQDFGDPYGAYDPQGFSSPTRGVFAGGQGPSPHPSETKIHYVTIASLGNSIKFGDLTVGVYGPAAASNSTRGIVAGGYNAPGASSALSRIDYVTIASTGNATHFGDLALGVRSTSAVSNNNRVAICGGINPSSTTNSIQYITISSTGDAQDFGDLTAPKEQLSGFSDSHGGLGGF